MILFQKREPWSETGALNVTLATLMRKQCFFCVRVQHACMRAQPHTHKHVTTLKAILHVFALLYQCDTSLLNIMNGYQFNFLSKQFPLITHRKNWLILRKSHREVLKAIQWLWPLPLCQFSLSLWFGRLFCATLKSQLFCPGAPRSLVLQRQATSAFSSRSLSRTSYPPGLQ